jgi:hypothetical protein
MAFGYRLPLSVFLPKRESRTDCVTVVFFVKDNRKFVTKQTSGLARLLAGRESKCIANTSCFFLQFPLWDSKGAVCESMKFFRSSASSVVLFANCASHRCGLHVSSLTSRVTTSAPLNARDVQTLR